MTAAAVVVEVVAGVVVVVLVMVVVVVGLDLLLHVVLEWPRAPSVDLEEADRVVVEVPIAG